MMKIVTTQCYINTNSKLWLVESLYKTITYIMKLTCHEKEELEHKSW